VTFLFRENAAAAAEVIATGRAAGRPITAEQVDVRDAQDCAEAVERVAERCGRIDVLVNNAALVRDGLLGLLGEDDVRTVLETNVGGVFNVTRAVVAHMSARRACKIINICSAAAERGARSNQLCRQQGGDQRLHPCPGGRAGAAPDHGQRRGPWRHRNRHVAGHPRLRR